MPGVWHTFKISPYASHPVVTEKQSLESWKLRKALKDDDGVVGQVDAVKLVLRHSSIC